LCTSRGHAPRSLRRRSNFWPDEVGRQLPVLDRFRREARAASALNHPNICTIYDVGEEQGQAFRAMEYLEGQDAQSTGSTESRCLPTSCSISAFRSADALDAAHSKASCTATIKPATSSSPGHARRNCFDFGWRKSTPDAIRTQLSEGETLKDLDQPRQRPGNHRVHVPRSRPRRKKLDRPYRTVFSPGCDALRRWTTGQAGLRRNKRSAVHSSRHFFSTRKPGAVAPAQIPDLPLQFERILDRALEKDRRPCAISSAAEMRRENEDPQSHAGFSKRTGAAAPEPRAIRCGSRGSTRFGRLPKGSGLAGVCGVVISGHRWQRCSRDW